MTVSSFHWNVVTRVPIRKGKDDPEASPFITLDIAGKILKKVIKPRSTDTILVAGAVLPKPFNRH